MAIETKFIQPDNPTDEERHGMLRMALAAVNRSEDFENIVELLSPPKDITKILEPGSCKGIKVGIIGGGLAGLSSAFELRKLGFDITIFESEESRIGGRVYTYYFDKDKRFYGELGAMRIPVVHETTWHYINTFGLKTMPFIQNNENAFIYVRNKRARNDPSGKGVMENIYPEFDLTKRERHTPWQRLIINALGSNLYKLTPSIRKELLQIKKEYSMVIQYLDSHYVRRVLKRMGLSEGAIELISCVDPFIGGIYYNSYLEYLNEDYNVNYAYRYQIVGGAVNLPVAFYNSLMSKKPEEYPNIDEDNLGKINWKSGTTVMGIYKGNKPDKTLLQYKNEKSQENFNEYFDLLICAIPFSSLRDVDIYPMFSSGKMQAIKEITYASAQKTLFMCNERFWEKGNKSERIIGGGSSTDLPIETIWYTNHYENSNPNSPGVLLASYNLNQDAVRIGNLDGETRFYIIKRQVEAVHNLPKGYLDSVVSDYATSHWDKMKGFYGAFCYFMPEQQSLFSYIMTEPEYNNRVYFAGEHISLTHAWMQGALNTGMKAANAIAEYCKNMINEINVK